MTTATMEERVARGAAWLDDVSPGWRDRIDLSSLRMADTCLCVLGQVFGQAADEAGGYSGYWWALSVYAGNGNPDSEEPQPYLADVWATEHGFFEPGLDYPALQDAWVAELTRVPEPAA